MGAVLQYFYFYHRWYIIPQTKALVLTAQFGILVSTIVAFAWIHGRGILRKGQIVFSGMLIASIKALVMLLAYSFLYFQQPNTLEEIKNDTLNKQEHLSKIQNKPFEREEAKKTLEISSKPANWGVAKLFSNLFSGLFASVFVALFFGKSPNPNET